MDIKWHPPPGAKKIGESTITIAEGIALRDDLVHALDHGWRNLIVEGDSKLIIDCVLRKVSIPWRVAYALAGPPLVFGSMISPY
ncbi:unnamed protein product [Prunus armeniaca]